MQHACTGWQPWPIYIYCAWLSTWAETTCPAVGVQSVYRHDKYARGCCQMIWSMSGGHIRPCTHTHRNLQQSVHGVGHEEGWTEEGYPGWCPLGGGANSRVWREWILISVCMASRRCTCSYIYSIVRYHTCINNYYGGSWNRADWFTYHNSKIDYTTSYILSLY